VDGGDTDCTGYARGCILIVGIAVGVGPMNGQLGLHLSEESRDAQRLTVLTGYIRGEPLLQLHIDDLTALQPSERPHCFRAFGVATLGALSIALGFSPEGLRSLSAIRHWRERREETRRPVRLPTASKKWRRYPRGEEMSSPNQPFTRSTLGELH
jgi:hypothetical protein